jgi:threonine synthase
MPADVPQSNYLECAPSGAHVTLVDGLISDCAQVMAERAADDGWFDMSTFHEPTSVEGKKTMGYELAEQFRWTLPDAIPYPTGGGVGLWACGRRSRNWKPGLGGSRASGPHDCGAGRTVAARW